MAKSCFSWSQQAYIKASITETFDRFGTFVAIDTSGKNLVVSAEDEDSNASGFGGDESLVIFQIYCIPLHDCMKINNLRF